MIRRIRISRRSQVAWIPKDLIEAGYVGAVPFLSDASAVVLMHPRATIHDVEESLRIIIERLQLHGRLRHDTPSRPPMEEPPMAAKKCGSGMSRSRLPEASTGGLEPRRGGAIQPSQEGGGG